MVWVVFAEKGPCRHEVPIAASIAASERGRMRLVHLTMNVRHRLTHLCNHHLDSLWVERVWLVSL